MTDTCHTGTECRDRSHWLVTERPLATREGESRTEMDQIG